MSRSFNTLKTSDVTTTPIKLKYTASYDSSSLSSNGVLVLTGMNNSLSITGSDSQETVNYYTFRHLYYSSYLTGSFPVSSSSAINQLQSTAASGTADADKRYFPTQSSNRISILAIPRSLTGEKISRGSFSIVPKFSYDYYIVDDGNGNLVDVASDELYVKENYFRPPENYTTGYVVGSPRNAHVGNIFYTQGVAVITNQDYVNVLKPNATSITITNRLSTVEITLLRFNRDVIVGIPPNTTALMPNIYTSAPSVNLDILIRDTLRRIYAVTVEVDKGFVERRTTEFTSDPGQTRWTATAPSIPLGSLVNIIIDIGGGGSNLTVDE